MFSSWEKQSALGILTASIAKGPENCLMEKQ